MSLPETSLNTSENRGLNSSVTEALLSMIESPAIASCWSKTGRKSSFFSLRTAFRIRRILLYSRSFSRNGISYMPITWLKKRRLLSGDPFTK